MKPYTISYNNLVLNALLDTIKREERRTIDQIDIANYEKIIKSLAKEHQISLTVKDFDDIEKFRKEMEQSGVLMGNNDDGTCYTLFPWIDEEDFEPTLKNTIFVSMDPVYAVTKESLRFARTYKEKDKLKKLEREITRYYISVTKETIKSLEQTKLQEEVKLEKMQANLYYRRK